MLSISKISLEEFKSFPTTMIRIFFSSVVTALALARCEATLRDTGSSLWLEAIMSGFVMKVRFWDLEKLLFMPQEKCVHNTALGNI